MAITGSEPLLAQKYYQQACDYNYNLELQTKALGMLTPYTVVGIDRAENPEKPNKKLLLLEDI